MSKIFIEETTLTSIGDAIREKGGTTALIAPLDMADAITNLPSGGGGGADVEPIVLEGYQSYGCAGSLGGAYINKFGNTISTKDLTNIDNMFYRATNLIKVPFDINCKKGYSAMNISFLFNDCESLKELPAIKNLYVGNMNYIFSGCKSLIEIPDYFYEDWDWSNHDNGNSGYSGNRSYMFNKCYKLRNVPMKFLEHGNPVVVDTYSIYYRGFQECYSLDEIIDLPNPHLNATWTSNAFDNAFTSCHHLKALTFKLDENNMPYVVKWQKQKIDLYVDNYSAVGYVNSNGDYTTSTSNDLYKNGFSLDTCVTNDEEYQALKNNPDWWTYKVEYSRYNHDSAVATINSLPDASAYLASSGGTANTIKFRAASGSATDGGAISNLTEEEIAVATAKGWTVTLA